MEPYYERIFLAFGKLRCEESVWKSSFRLCGDELVYYKVDLAVLRIGYLARVDDCSIGRAEVVYLLNRILHLERVVVAADICERAAAVYVEAVFELKYDESARFGAFAVFVNVLLVVYICVYNVAHAVKRNRIVVRIRISRGYAEAGCVDGRAVDLHAGVYRKGDDFLTVRCNLCDEVKHALLSGVGAEYILRHVDYGSRSVCAYARAES